MRLDGNIATATVAARTRIVSAAGIRLDHRKSLRPFKGIICDDISEFESHMPSHAVASLRARQASWRRTMARISQRDGTQHTMSYDLAAAAAATGLNTASILRAIKSGKISGTKDALGQW